MKLLNLLGFVDKNTDFIKSLGDQIKTDIIKTLADSFSKKEYKDRINNELEKIRDDIDDRVYSEDLDTELMIELIESYD